MSAESPRTGAGHVFWGRVSWSLRLRNNLNKVLIRAHQNANESNLQIAFLKFCVETIFESTERFGAYAEYEYGL